MKIRRAIAKDIPRIGTLLEQVNEVHHKGRPDLFGCGCKYTDRELEDILADDLRPVFVAVDDDGVVVGYAFCMLQQHEDSHILKPVRTLYVDDLCVDEACRGQHVGKTVYEAVVEFARIAGCYNLTLNVWSCNPSAMKFYERCGLVPQKVGMELVLDTAGNSMSGHDD